MTTMREAEIHIRVDLRSPTDGAVTVRNPAIRRYVQDRIDALPAAYPPAPARDPERCRQCGAALGLREQERTDYPRFCDDCRSELLQRDNA